MVALLIQVQLDIALAPSSVNYIIETLRADNLYLHVQLFLARPDIIQSKSVLVIIDYLGTQVLG